LDILPKTNEITMHNVLNPNTNAIKLQNENRQEENLFSCCCCFGLSAHHQQFQMR